MIEDRQPIAIGGSVAQRAGYGGHAWAFAQYLLGFRSLGYAPLLIDRLTDEMLGAGPRSASQAQERAIRWLERAMRSLGLDGCWCLLLDDRASAGMPREEALRQLADAPLLLNVMGFVTDEEVLAAVPRRVFLDIDPGFGQMWRELGLADVFRGHDAYVTIAENIGHSDCTVPDCGLEWTTTRPPVALDAWPKVDGGDCFTTVASWRGPFEPVEYRGRRYGVRAHEFRRFADLPRLTAERFEAVLDIDEADRADAELLRDGGWNLLSPADAAGDPASYRSYVQSSRAELMVAKQMYVETRGGWFSDRSACYLASGKPVVAQDTGFSRNYPVGEGLLPFEDLEGAIAAVEEVNSDPRRHADAARAIAEEHLDARKVLATLLDELGVR